MPKRDSSSKHYNKTNHTYESLVQAASHYPNEKNYCAVIALALSLGINFGKARKILLEQGRKTGEGTLPRATHRAIEQGGKRIEYMPRSSTGTVGTLTRRLPSKGTFLIHVARHILTVVDGKVQDWSITQKPRMAVRMVFQVIDYI